MPTYNDVANLILTNLDDAIPGGITATAHRAVEQSLLDFAKEIAEAQWLQGDIKEIDCTQQYILDNFVQSGPEKGKGNVGGPREGWAICNGFNGTRNRTGRVSIAWGDVTPLGTVGEASQFTSMGTTINAPIIGGQKDAVIIDHTHEYQDACYAENGGHKPTGNMGGSGDTDGDNGFYYRTRSGAMVGSPPAVGSRPLTDNPQSSTGSGLNKNMQPYIVTLFIQKL
jgi:hypothetical protein